MAFILYTVTRGLVDQMRHRSVWRITYDNVGTGEFYSFPACDLAEVRDIIADYADDCRALIAGSVESGTVSITTRDQGFSVMLSLELERQPRCWRDEARRLWQRLKVS